MSGSDARALSRSLLDLCRMRKLTIATAETIIIREWLEVNILRRSVFTLI